jgi:uncharacterized membrane protein YeaQ/YmgE (transglycosylase-associated protein family)
VQLVAIVLVVVGLGLAFFLFGAVVSILYYLVAGLVVGAVARLVLPGKENIGLLGTALVGIAGSMLGGVAGRVLNVGAVLELVLAVAAAALLLAVLGFRARSSKPRS